MVAAIIVTSIIAVVGIKMFPIIFLQTIMTILDWVLYPFYYLFYNPTKLLKSRYFFTYPVLIDCITKLNLWNSITYFIFFILTFYPGKRKMYRSKNYPILKFSSNLNLQHVRFEKKWIEMLIKSITFTICFLTQLKNLLQKSVLEGDHFWGKQR